MNSRETPAAVPLIDLDFDFEDDFDLDIASESVMVRFESEIIAGPSFSGLSLRVICLVLHSATPPVAPPETLDGGGSNSEPESGSAAIASFLVFSSIKESGLLKKSAGAERVDRTASKAVEADVITDS